MSESKVILDVRNLSTYFFTKRGTVHAAEDVSFTLGEGEFLGIVGESGSGKSVTSLSIMKLVRRPGEIVSGEIMYDGKDVLKMDDAQLRSLRGGDIAMIFQEPLSTLNPSFTIGWQIEDTLRLHTDLDKAAIRQKAIDILKSVKIPEPENRLDDYPHQFSGGMRQRVLIAIALACSPKVLIADEPTTALDVTVQADIMDLLEELKEEFNLSILFISHNLNLIGERCSRIAVMYAGRIVEIAPTKALFEKPRHPYTEGLLKAIPSRAKNERLIAIPGDVPVIFGNEKGCLFRDRCPYAADICAQEMPELKDLGEGHFCRCHRSSEVLV